MFNDNVYFEIVHGKHVFCDFSEPENAQKKIVIMSHGFRGTNDGPARQFVDFGRILNKEGFSVLRFDQLHSANSEGDYVDSSFKEWVYTIVYFANKFLKEGYEVNLLGQSMGASATIAATFDPLIKNKIPCILLWVPDPETDFVGNPNDILEEGGQKYKNSFWQEAMDSNIFTCLDAYQGKIHLVYGEIDRYVSRELVDKTVQLVKDKGQEVLILKGQDHSPWEYNLVHEVYRQELAKLKE
jgi:predicted alpha/beta-fold hydrolase